MAKVTSIKNVASEKVSFKEIRQWHETHLHPSVIDFEDQKPFQIYEQGRWAGIFQLTSAGAQKLFIKAKPKSVIDIAALTSIYRPGPLAANVDKLWLQHEKVPFDWGHPLINETLKETRGLLVFQEGVMALVNKVSGFPLAETDEVRRAIMKRSISGGEAAKKKMQELEDSVVEGAVKNGVPRDTAKKMYETICFMSGYGFNRAHAVAYAIDSFWCAWLMTYFEEEWITAYIESMSGDPDDKAKAFSEVRKLGYKIVPIDINEAGLGWRVLPGKRLMPSFLSCKGIGASAVSEILENRPYKSIEDLLWNEDGSWRHSKFNSKAMGALINVGGFESLGIVGDHEGAIFDSYAHMSHVIIDNKDQIKKTSKKDPKRGMTEFYRILRESTGEIEGWSRREIAERSIEHFGYLDVGQLVDPSILEVFESKEIAPVDQYEDQGIYWFAAMKVEPKMTRTGKGYLLIHAQGPSGRTVRLNCWGWDGKRKIEPYAICFAEMKQNDYGISTDMKKLRELA